MGFISVDVKLWSVVKNLLCNETDCNFSLSDNLIDSSPPKSNWVFNKTLNILLFNIFWVILFKSNIVLPSFVNLVPPNLSVYAGDTNVTHLILLQNSGFSKHFNNTADPWLVDIATTFEFGGNDLTLFNSAVQSYIKSKDIGKTFNTSGSIPNVLLVFNLNFEPAKFNEKNYYELVNQISSVLKNINPDYPRNLAKSVTVD